MDPTLKRWQDVANEATYYQLFGVTKSASPDAIRHAFLALCKEFHPDGHRSRPAPERAAVLAIFSRINEAYRILQDGGLRAQYDAAVERGEKRLNDHAAQGYSAHGSLAPRAMRLEDHVKTPSAKTFARKAEELFNRGEAKQAKLTLAMATSFEPDNPELAAFAERIQALLK